MNARTPTPGGPLARYGTALRLYDNGGKTCDRFTILPPRWAGKAHHYSRNPRAPRWSAIASGPAPFHPQGYGQHVGADAGPHLGRRIKWAELPADVQRFARQAFPEFAPATT